jgi:predicted esterase
LVLFHGLGETGNPALGLRAWPELYGLSRAYERLTQPPVARISKPARYLPDSRLRQLNASLAADPFRGFGVVCPVTPNAYKIGAKGLDRYADWVANALLPEVERRATFQREPHARGIDGCSLGGYVALEVFSRQPHLFGSVGSVQGAFGRERAAAYAAAIARAHTELGPRSVHVQSSLEDPYRGAAEHLAKQLSSHGVPHEVCIPPGPHDQAWLREVGTLEMLLWYDRALRAR